MLLLILYVSDVDPVDPKPVIVTKEKTVVHAKTMVCSNTNNT